jgi:hypothetical protein
MMARHAARITDHPIADSLAFFSMLVSSSCRVLGLFSLLSLREKSRSLKEPFPVFIYFFNLFGY